MKLVCVFCLLALASAAPAGVDAGNSLAPMMNGSPRDEAVPPAASTFSQPKAVPEPQAAPQTPPPAPIPALAPPPTAGVESAMNGGQFKKDLLIAVVTAPKHSGARRAIQNTWAVLNSKQAERVDVRYFVGDIHPDTDGIEELEMELRDNPHVVRLHFIENYHNLTLKAKGIFDWAHKNGYRALLKVDDDSYVNVANVLKYIDSHADVMDRIYAGHINRQEFGECYVHKSTTSKWYMYDQYPHEQFPDFADGPGFLLGSVALKFLSENKDTLFDYRCDDAAVGIWTDGLGLAKTDMKVSIYEFGCSENDIIINPLSAGEMYTLFTYPYICESGYTLDVCLDRPCLCKGHPDRTRCWQEIIDKPYEDIIPRLIQTSAEITQPSL